MGDRLGFDWSFAMAKTIRCAVRLSTNPNLNLISALRQSGHYIRTSECERYCVAKLPQRRDSAALAAARLAALPQAGAASCPEGTPRASAESCGRRQELTADKWNIQSRNSRLERHQMTPPLARSAPGTRHLSHRGPSIAICCSGKLAEESQ